MESRIPRQRVRNVVLAVALTGLFLLLALWTSAARPGVAAGPTPVSGAISAPTTWLLADSPYIVSGIVSVEGSGVLTIEAGVEVLFDADAELQVNSGPLSVLGTAAQPVTFRGNSATLSRGFWNGIFFADTALPSSFEHCLVEYADIGVSIGGDTDHHSIRGCTFRHNGDGGDWTSGGAINSAGDVLTLVDNQIYDNELGLRLHKSFGDVITGNQIYDNDGYGIGFVAANAPGGGNNLIAANEIHNNGGFGLGFVPQGIYEGGSSNEIIDNQIYANTAAGSYPGDGIYLDTGSNNILSGNRVEGNERHGIFARNQTALQFTANVVRGNGQDGLAYADPNAAPLALHSNVLCGNGVYDLESTWSGSLVAEGNWFGTNAPASGAEIAGTVDWSPWISMAVVLTPPTLPADGLSTASFDLTMSSGSYVVPDGYTVTVSADAGSLAPSILALSGGAAHATYTAGTTAGAVEFSATDLCATLNFSTELTLETVDLAIDKRGPGGVTHPGEVVAYTVVVTELNGVDARSVVITDSLPAGATWAADTSASCGLSRQSTVPDLVWTAAQWDGGTSCQFEVSLLVGGDACQPATLVNAVEIASAAVDDDLTNNSAATTTDSPAVSCLDLAVSKTSSGLLVGPNKDYSVEYTIVVSNVGLIAASGVVLTDVLPAGTVYEGGPWSCAGGVCSRTVGDLLPSASLVLTLPLRIEPASLTCPGRLINVVQVGGGGGDIDPTDNVFTQTTTFDCLPDLVVVINDNVGPTTTSVQTAGPAWPQELLGYLPEAEIQADCVFTGQWITYTIAYVNAGLATATHVVLTETLPAHTSYVGYGWTPVGGGIYTRAVGTLAPGMGDVAHFVVRVDSTPPDLSVEDEVRIGGAEEDLYPPDNVSADDTPICEGLFLQVRKETDTPCAFPGDEIRYTITFTNTTSETAPGVVLSETVPANTSYLATAGWVAVGGGQFVYEYGDLSAGASASVEFVVIVDDPLADTVTDVVNTVCLGYAGPTPPGNCFTLVTPLPLEPDLRVVKHDYVGPPLPLATQRELDRMYHVLFGSSYQPPASIEQWEPVRPGDVYSYTITYLNMGRATASGVVLTETLPAHTSYVGYGWTHVGGNVYTYAVGDLAPGTGGQRDVYVRVGAVPCDGDGYLYNWVTIAGNEAECNLANNWSGEETPVECQAAVTYLPIILKNAATGEEPTPTPSPSPSATASPTPSPTPEPAYVSDVAVNAETNRVYVASPRLDAVFAVDPGGAGSVVATIPVGDHPLGLAVVTTTNKIYAANLNSWTVTAIRGSDYARLADIYVGAQACKVAADAGDARVYATNHLESDNGAAAIDSHSDTFEYYYTRLHATQGRYGIDVDPAAEKLFIAARDAGLIVIQDAYLPNQEPQVFKLDPPRVPYVVAWNPATGHLFVTAADDRRVVVLDPYSIQWAAGKWLYWRQQWVFEFDQTNAGWIKEIGVGAGAEEGIAVNAQTGYVYVTNADDDTLSVIRDDVDPANIQWVQDIAVGNYPQGVDVDVKTNTIYVGNAESRDLTVIDGATHTVVKTIPLE